MQLQDESGLVLRSFDSLAEAARYFGVDPKTAKYWIQVNKSVRTRSAGGDEIGENKYLRIIY